MYSESIWKDYCTLWTCSTGGTGFSVLKQVIGWLWYNLCTQNWDVVRGNLLSRPTCIVPVTEKKKNYSRKESFHFLQEVQLHCNFKWPGPELLNDPLFSNQGMLIILFSPLPMPTTLSLVGLLNSFQIFHFECHLFPAEPWRMHIPNPNYYFLFPLRTA